MIVIEIIYYIYYILPHRVFSALQSDLLNSEVRYFEFYIQTFPVALYLTPIIIVIKANLNSKYPDKTQSGNTLTLVSSSINIFSLFQSPWLCADFRNCPA